MTITLSSLSLIIKLLIQCSTQISQTAEVDIDKEITTNKHNWERSLVGFHSPSRTHTVRT